MTTCRRSKLALWIENRQQPTQTQHNDIYLYIIISAIPGSRFWAVQCHYFHFCGISERSIMILCRVWKRTILGTQVHRKTWDAFGVGWGIWRCKPPKKTDYKCPGLVTTQNDWIALCPMLSFQTALCRASAFGQDRHC